MSRKANGDWLSNALAFFPTLSVNAREVVAVVVEVAGANLVLGFATAAAAVGATLVFEVVAAVVGAFGAISVFDAVAAAAVGAILVFEVEAADPVEPFPTVVVVAVFVAVSASASPAI